MNHKPGSLEEAAQAVLLNELSGEPNKRAKTAMAIAIDAIDKLRGRERDTDILIAYQQIMDAIDGNKPLIAKTIRAIKAQDES